MRMLAGVLIAGLAAGQAAAPGDGVSRVAGTDAGSGIAYVLLSVGGKPVGAGGVPNPAPRLTGVCTRTAAGKLKFEVMADLGGVAEVAYDPPWRPSSSAEYPPRLEKALATMEFLGYTKVKPVKRGWEYVASTPGELRYQTPGMGSPNLEEFAYYMQYLKSLPTLRLTVPGKGAAEWETTKWRQALRAEPMCSASGA